MLFNLMQMSEMKSMLDFGQLDEVTIVIAFDLKDTYYFDKITF